MDKEFLIYALGLVLAILGWMLRQKDAAQQRSIDLLFKKHDEDAAALSELKLHVAGEHYKRGELDAKFDKLETAFREELGAIGKKLDKLSDVLIERAK